MSNRPKPTEAEQSDFWDWFAASSQDGLISDKELLAGVGQRLEAIGVDRWEVGPDDNEKEFFLAISPAALAELPAMERFVSAAPPINGWRIQVGKPAKRWDRRFLWGEGRIGIDASDWRFEIYRYADGMFELALTNPGLPGAVNSQRDAILAFVIESELGELMALRTICKLGFIDDADCLDVSATVAINQLKQAVSPGMPHKPQVNSH